MSKPMFEQFNELYEMPTQELTAEYILKSATLVSEEIEELLKEAYGNVKITIEVSEPKTSIDPAKVCGEFADISYFNGQRATEGGINMPQALNAKHFSNMSKVIPPYFSEREVQKELDIARKRYPDAYLVEAAQGGHIIKCRKTNKLIKPTCYHPALFMQGVHYV